MRLSFIFFTACMLVILYIFLFLPSVVLSIYFRTLSSEAELNEIATVFTARQIAPIKNHSGQAIRFNAIQMKAPWREVASRQQSRENIVVRSKQNQVLMLTVTGTEQMTVVDTFLPNKEIAEEAKKVFEEQPRKTDLALYQTIIKQSPSEVHFSPLKNLTSEEYVLMSSRELFATLLSGNKSSGSFSTTIVHGVQVGNPRAINKVLILLSDQSQEQYSLWFSDFSQQEIDIVLATITTADSLSSHW